MIIAQEILDKLYEINLGKSTVAVISTPATDISIPSFFTASLDIIGFVFNLLGNIYDLVTGLITA